MLHLGVNVDHVATLRQARRTTYPDPLFAALIAEHTSGAQNRRLLIWSLLSVEEWLRQYQ